MSKNFTCKEIDTTNKNMIEGKSCLNGKTSANIVLQKGVKKEIEKEIEKREKVQEQKQKEKEKSKVIKEKEEKEMQSLAMQGCGVITQNKDSVREGCGKNANAYQYNFDPNCRNKKIIIDPKLSKPLQPDSKSYTIKFCSKTKDLATHKITGKGKTKKLIPIKKGGK